MAPLSNMGGSGPGGAREGPKDKMKAIERRKLKRKSKEGKRERKRKEKKQKRKKN